MNEEKKFAVLIDADNISSHYIKIIIDEITEKGIVTYKRIYGDWTRNEMGGWKSLLLEYSLTPMQQYSYTTGKNSTDSALIIDAMDILYTDSVDGFCLVSSDSDFTKLASRLREAGMTVIGMGEKKTPRPFVTACDEFKFIDEIEKTEKAEKEAARTQAAAKAPAPVRNEKDDKDSRKDSDGENDSGSVKEQNSQTRLSAIRSTITQRLANFSDEEGWMAVSVLGSVLSKRYPDFDVRNFGYKKLVPFLESLGGFELRAEPNPDNSSGKITYIRINPNKTRRKHP